jgi:FKBP-type peptidyl-prolyl cis-trans isomerase (trigger factor)
MEQQGYKIKDYLQHTRQTEEEYREKTISPQAMRRVQAEVLLSAIRTAQDISATDVEVSAEVEKVIAQYGSPEVVERLRAKLVPGDTYYAEIADRVAYRKVVDMFWE